MDTKARSGRDGTEPRRTPGEIVDAAAERAAPSRREGVGDVAGLGAAVRRRKRAFLSRHDHDRFLASMALALAVWLIGTMLWSAVTG